MSYRWSKLFANINLSSQKPVNRSTDKYLAGEFLTSSSFEFGVKQDRLLMSLIYQHANTIYFDSTNLRQGADFKTLDFTSSYQLANSTRIFFGLKNLLNNQNQLNNGFPAPLRQFFTSVNFTY
jgi:outer membrane cobalamin receptor